MIYIELFGIRMNLYAQIAGLIGLVLIVWSYQLRKTAFLALSGVAFVFFLAESCILAADSDTFTGIVLNAAGLHGKFGQHLQKFSLAAAHLNEPLALQMVRLNQVPVLAAPELHHSP